VGVTGEQVQIRGTDALIAIGLGLEWTQEQAAEFAGCTSRTVRNRKDVEEVQWLSAKISAAVSRDQATFERKTREFYESQLEERLPLAIKKAIDGSLKSDDLKDFQWAFDRISDRVMGKPTQRQEIAGSIENRHVYELPSDVMQVFVSAAREIKGLPAPQDVIEGEVIDDDGAGE
jgi:hypothetical protein